jgi:methionyl-tRNA formyltransferase
MNIVFMGSGTFAVPILERLSESGGRLMAVITPPDRPAGRGQEMTQTPVKAAAQARSIHLFQPPDVNSFEFIRELNGLSPDVIVVADFGQKLGREILALPRYYCVNVHPSLLPRYRGATPVPRALVNGDTYTGVTVIRVVDQMDAGPILGAVKVPIPTGVSTGELEASLARVGADLVVEVLGKIDKGTALEIPQDERHATYAKKLEKVDGKIDWGAGADAIAAFVKAMDPYPGAYAFVGGLRTRVLQARSVVLQDPPTLPPGTIVALDRKAIWVCCKDGVIGIEQLQPAGKNPMSAGDYLNGHRLRIGDALR